MDRRLGWLSWLVTMILSIGPSAYHVTFEPDAQNAEVRLVIFSDTNGTPYQAIHAIDVDGNQSSVDIPRHTLPKGGYIIYAELMRWMDCELVAVDGSGGVAIHVP